MRRAQHIATMRELLAALEKLDEAAPGQLELIEAVRDVHSAMLRDVVDEILA
jgi:argininosuccinate lyase